MMGRFDRGLLVLVLLSGCSETGFSTVDKTVGGEEPRIDVSPLSLEFWVGGATTEDVQSFTIRSVGWAPLSIEAIELVPVEGEAASFRFDQPSLGGFLEVDDSVEVSVEFTPQSPGEVSDVITIRSSDPTTPEVEVSLTGRADTPSLWITPENHDFGTHRVGCPTEVELQLENVGTAALTIEDWGYEGDAGLAHVPTESLPIVLAPGSWIYTTVELDPISEGALAGSFWVDSTDPRGRLTAEQVATGEAAGSGEDTFPVDDDLPVDILVAVDRSASMDDDAVRLASGFADFIAVLDAATTGWHLGVVTLDSGCFNGGVLTVDTPDLQATFADAVSTGSDLDIALDESLLQLSNRALEASADGECNEGFRREGALLHTIVVSDEPERSAEEAAAWTWEFWVDRMVEAVGGASVLQISGIVDSEDCNEGADGYLEAIAATGGEVHSVCATDWGEALASLAEASLGRLRTLALSGDPVPASIQVWLDGVEVTDGWVYDEEQNAVVMGAVDGSELRVTYLIDAECPE
jgi:hypothetical protein